MINSVSGVSFRGEVDTQALLNQPGKYTTQAPIPETEVDTFNDKPAGQKKSHIGAVIGTVVGLLAATYIGLGIAVGKGKLNKAVAAEGGNLTFMQKTKNFFVSVGENAKKCWDTVCGWFGKGKKAVEEGAEGGSRAVDDAESAAAAATEAVE